MRTLILTAATLLLTPLSGSAQLMPAEQERIWRSYFPKLEESRNLNEKIAQATLYTDAEFPKAYQFQPLVGGQGTPYTVFYSPFVRLNDIDPFTNGNMEDPWRNPAGLGPCDRTKTREVRFFWLPPNPNGGLYPIIVWRGLMDPSDSVNMPTPTQGWKWIFPADAIVGELLIKQFADGSWAPYEMRLRLRELDDWDTEREVPVTSLAELREMSGQEIADARPQTLRYVDQIHEEKTAFDITGTVIHLPPIQNAADLLRQATFKPASGKTMESGATGFTASDHENIVPAKFLGGLLSGSRESCIECHRHSQMHVDRFSRRDWYGAQMGSTDGIRTVFPFSPASIGPPDKPVRLRDELVSAGMVAMYDPAKHPSSVYQIAPKYDNTPADLTKRRMSPRTRGGR